jgi:hypothetical protein
MKTEQIKMPFMQAGGDISRNNYRNIRDEQLLFDEELASFAQERYTQENPESSTWPQRQIEGFAGRVVLQFADKKRKDGDKTKRFVSTDETIRLMNLVMAACGYKYAFKTGQKEFQPDIFLSKKEFKPNRWKSIEESLPTGDRSDGDGQE